MVERISSFMAPPEMADLMLAIKRDIALSINCIQIGTIDDYDPITNTAKAKINFKRRLGSGDIVNYPVLADCPVFVLSGGDSFISCPITRDDECLVLFNDRNIDNWWYSGDIDVPDNTRCHDIADGIILVGVKSLPNATNASSKPSTNTIRISGGSKKIAIVNDTTDLKTQLDALITNINSVIDTCKSNNSKIIDVLSAITAITVTCSAPGSPSSAPINSATFVTYETSFTGFNTNLSTYKTNLSAAKTALDNLLDAGAT